MQSLRITHKLLIAIFALVALLGAASLFGVFSLHQRLQENSTTARSGQAGSHALGELRSNFQTQVQEWKNTLIRGKDPEKRERFWTSFQESEAKVQAIAQTLGQRFTENKHHELLLQFAAAHTEMGKAYRVGYAAFVAADSKIEVGDKAVSGVDREANRLLGELSAHITESLTTTIVEADLRAKKTVQTTLGILVAATIIGLVFAVFFARSLVRPILICVEAMQHLAQGDLTVQVAISRKDELGNLGNAINTCTANLRQLIGSLTQSATDLHHSAETLTETAHSQAAAAEETTVQSSTVAAAGKELSINAKAMSESAAQITQSTSTVASAMAEMSSSIQEVARNCAHENEIARKADTQARETRALMGKLDESARQIGKVVELINRIAEQTNLLALNATIEAASAGEAGRGFAVVANEVKELARQSAAATEDIRKQVGLIQDNTGASMRSLDEVAKIIEQVTHISSSVAAAVAEQSATTSEIVGTIHGVSTSTGSLSTSVQQTAEGADEVARNIAGVSTAAADGARGATLVSSSATELTALSATLSQLVAKFKI